MRFGDVCRTRLLEPAGMHSSGFLDVPGDRAISGWRDGVERVDIAFTCVGDGGFVSTVGDLARWDAWLPASPLAPLMLAPRQTLADGVVAHDAWGISIRPHRGLRIESHGGSIDGHLAVFVRFPEVGTTFLALANDDSPGVAGLVAQMEALIGAVLADRLDMAQPSWTTSHGLPIAAPG